MKQLRPRGAQTRSVSARDSFPRTDLRNLETAYRKCSLLVSVVLTTARESRWRCFEAEHLSIATKAFFDLRLALLTTRLVFPLLVGTILRVLCHHLAGGVVDLVVN